MDFLRAETVYLPVKAHPMFPLSLCTELASSLVGIWYDSASNTQFQTDDHENSLLVRRGVFLASIPRPISKTQPKVGQYIYSIVNGGNPLFCEQNCVFCLHYEKVGLLDLYNAIIRFHDQRIKNSSGKNPQCLLDQGYGRDFRKS